MLGTFEFHGKFPIVKLQKMSHFDKYHDQGINNEISSFDKYHVNEYDRKS